MRLNVLDYELMKSLRPESAPRLLKMAGHISNPCMHSAG